MAAVTSMYQSLLEGKTDCPISGVFGAGKTLSAAAMIAGLLVMDPSLTIMIVTKENVAAHAFVKHFLRLELPESIICLVGRLVGYVEMKKGPANQTALDIPPAFRNDVLRNKRVLVGCGGGFHQECQVKVVEGRRRPTVNNPDGEELDSPTNITIGITGQARCQTRSSTNLSTRQLKVETVTCRVHALTHNVLLTCQLPYEYLHT